MIRFRRKDWDGYEPPASDNTHKFQLNYYLIIQEVKAHYGCVVQQSKNRH